MAVLTMPRAAGRRGADGAAAGAACRRDSDASASTTWTSTRRTRAASPSSACPTTAPRRSPTTRSRCSTRCCAAIVALDRSVARGEWDREGQRARCERSPACASGSSASGGSATRSRRGCSRSAQRCGRTTCCRSRATGVRFVELDELLAECDAVTLHVPLTRETRGLIGRDADRVDAAGRAARQHVARRRSSTSARCCRRCAADGSAARRSTCCRRSRRRWPPLAPNLIVTPHAAYYSEASERAYRLCIARVREVLCGASRASPGQCCIVRALQVHGYSCAIHMRMDVYPAARTCGSEDVSTTSKSEPVTPAERVQVVVRPARVGRAGDVPVRAVVGDDHPVALQRLRARSAPARGKPRDVEARLQPHAQRPSAAASGRSSALA